MTTLIEAMMKNNSDNMVDISGLDKAEVLKALYDNTSVVGYGSFQHQQGLTIDDFSNVIKEGKARGRRNELIFDYVYGKPLKVDIAKDEFNALAYDADSKTPAKECIAALRNSKVTGSLPTPDVTTFHNFKESYQEILQDPMQFFRFFLGKESRGNSALIIEQFEDMIQNNANIQSFLGNAVADLARGAHYAVLMRDEVEDKFVNKKASYEESLDRIKTESYDQMRMEDLLHIDSEQKRKLGDYMYDRIGVWNQNLNIQESQEGIVIAEYFSTFVNEFCILDFAKYLEEKINREHFVNARDAVIKGDVPSLEQEVSNYPQIVHLGDDKGNTLLHFLTNSSRVSLKKGVKEENLPAVFTARVAAAHFLVSQGADVEKGNDNQESALDMSNRILAKTDLPESDRDLMTNLQTVFKAKVKEAASMCDDTIEEVEKEVVAAAKADDDISPTTTTSRVIANPLLSQDHQQSSDRPGK